MMRVGFWDFVIAPRWRDGVKKLAHHRAPEIHFNWLCPIPVPRQFADMDVKAGGGT